MTTAGKAAAGASVGLVAVLTLMISTQGLQFLGFITDIIRDLTGLPLFGPVVVAMVVGAVAPAWLPHVLPPACRRPYTLRLTRMFGCGIAFVMVASRYPSAVGLQYAMFASTGAYVLWTMGQNVVYRWFPQLKPPSLAAVDEVCGPSLRDAQRKAYRSALRDVSRWAEDAGEGATMTARKVRRRLADGN